VDLAAYGPAASVGDKRVDWKPRVPIAHGVQRTVDWQLKPSADIAGKLQALDRKTPLGSVVIELVQLDQRSSRPVLRSSTAEGGGNEALTSKSEIRNSKPETEVSLPTSLPQPTVFCTWTAMELHRTPPEIFAGQTVATFECWIRCQSFRPLMHVFEFGEKGVEAICSILDQAGSILWLSANALEQKSGVRRGSGIIWQGFPVRAGETFSGWNADSYFRFELSLENKA
jgi:hypothetical protein